MDFAENEGRVLAAWETGGQVYWAPVIGLGNREIEPVAAPGEGKGRKHPRLAASVSESIGKYGTKPSSLEHREGEDKMQGEGDNTNGPRDAPTKSCANGALPPCLRYEIQVLCQNCVKNPSDWAP